MHACGCVGMGAWKMKYIALKLSQQLSSPDFSSGVGLAVHGVREVMCNAWQLVQPTYFGMVVRCIATLTCSHSCIVQIII